MAIHQGNWPATTSKINSLFSEGGRIYTKDELKYAYDKERKAGKKLKDKHDPKKVRKASQVKNQASFVSNLLTLGFLQPRSDKKINANKIYEKDVDANVRPNGECKQAILYLCLNSNCVDYNTAGNQKNVNKNDSAFVSVPLSKSQR